MVIQHWIQDIQALLHDADVSRLKAIHSDVQRNRLGVCSRPRLEQKHALH